MLAIMRDGHTAGKGKQFIARQQVVELCVQHIAKRASKGKEIAAKRAIEAREIESGDTVGREWRGEPAEGEGSANTDDVDEGQY